MVPRALVGAEPVEFPQVFTEVLVVGSGVAGLRAAMSAAAVARVLLITKGAAPDGNTARAQGGVAAAVGPGDTAAEHAADTLAAGVGLCDADVVARVVAAGPDVAEFLRNAGVELDGSPDRFSLGREGGHRRARILHAGGDSTGRALERALLTRAAALPSLRIQEGVTLVDLLTTAEGRVCGAVVAVEGGELRTVRSGATVIATGGACRIYRESTNAATATGDGIAAAYRAGATLSDLEFVQFHPTVLYAAGAARFLITEAVRGAGATLVDRAGIRFMADVHELADLAPRDVVVRAIQRRLAESGDTHVFLDMTHLPAAESRARFPGVFETCAAVGLDPSRERIPVRPSAHYFIGGVRAGAMGETDLPGLFACGEAAATGLHGANRLASNSLLEGLVLGEITGRAAACEALRFRADGLPDPEALPVPGPRADGIDVEDVVAALRSLMGRRAGPERDGAGLRDAAGAIEGWERYVIGRAFDEPRGWELQNMVLISRLLVEAAAFREESRGTHRRADFPERDDARWLGHVDHRRGAVPWFRAHGDTGA